MHFLFQGCLGLSFKKDRAQLWVNNGQDYRMVFLGLSWGLFGQDGRITRFTG